MERNIALARAFATPYTVVIDNLGDPRTAGAAAVRAELTTIGNEMAGGGIVRSDALFICKRGGENLDTARSQGLCLCANGRSI